MTISYMYLSMLASSRQIERPVTSCHRKWSRIAFGFAIKSGRIPSDAADGPTKIARCGGYGLTTLPSILFLKTARQSLIDIGPAGWNITARTGASWVCRRRMVSDRRAWLLHLSSGRHFASSAWREICTGSRFLGNTKLASAQSKGAAVRCMVRWWFGQLSIISCNSSSPPRFSRCSRRGPGRGNRPVEGHGRTERRVDTRQPRRKKRRRRGVPRGKPVAAAGRPHPRDEERSLARACQQPDGGGDEGRRRDRVVQAGGRRDAGAEQERQPAAPHRPGLGLDRARIPGAHGGHRDRGD